MSMQTEFIQVNTCHSLACNLVCSIAYDWGLKFISSMLHNQSGYPLSRLMKLNAYITLSVVTWSNSNSCFPHSSSLLYLTGNQNVPEDWTPPVKTLLSCCLKSSQLRINDKKQLFCHSNIYADAVICNVNRVTLVSHIVEHFHLILHTIIINVCNNETNNVHLHRNLNFGDNSIFCSSERTRIILEFSLWALGNPLFDPLRVINILAEFLQNREIL